MLLMILAFHGPMVHSLSEGIGIHLSVTVVGSASVVCIGLNGLDLFECLKSGSPLDAVHCR